MAVNTGRTVYLRSDGQWANKSNNALRASGLHANQQLAAEEARSMLQTEGGGTLTIKDPGGGVKSMQQIASKD